MRKLIILFLLSTLFISKSYSQAYYELEDLFLDADSWFTYEDYKEALPLFLRVLEADSLNYNVMYKIGFCYLHIPGQKAKAIPYLENAIKKTTPNYRNNTYIEDLAPVDALFYLGNAYLVNNRINEAIDAYRGFQNAIQRTKRLANKDIYDTDYLNRQLDACRNALQLQYNPVNFLARNVGTPINTRFNEFNAVVSGDGKTLVFTASLQFYDAIFYAKKENGKWSFPMNIMGQLGVDDKSATTGLSYDGKELYIYRDDDFDGNIYVSFLKEDGFWSKVIKLNENINTKYWEAHASLSPDSKQLYFVSNRDGGFGDLDIYVADRITDTTWSVPYNMGEIINTRWNENSPFITPDGKRLFFSSEGHQGMGGYDIFYSDLKDGEWTEPVNIGYPINTTDNDVFFVPFEKGRFAYCSQFSKKGHGGRDIYQFHLFDLPGYSSFLVEGVQEIDNENDRNTLGFKINIIDKASQDTLEVLTPGENIKYQYQTPLGKNHLVYESPMNSEKGEQFYISAPYNIKEEFLNSIYKEEKETGTDTIYPEIYAEKKSYITENGNVKIKLNLKKGNKLFVDTYYNDSLIKTEEFDIDKENFTYKYKPFSGESTLKFRLVDNNKHEQTEEVTVTYLPKDNVAELDILEKTIQINSNGNKNIAIKLATERKSDLIVETFAGNKIIKTEEFKVRKKEFTYEFEPTGNETKLRFKLIDKSNNIATKEIAISNKPVNHELSGVIKEISNFNNVELLKLLDLPAIKNAKTAKELIQKLYSNAISKGISKDQVQILLTALALNITDDTPEFISALANLAEGDLKTVLKDIQAHQNDYNSPMDVVNELKEKSENNNYTVEDIISLLEEYIKQTNKPVSSLIVEMEEILKTDIKEIINNTKSKTDISNLKEFKQYIKDKGVYQGKELKHIISLVDATSLVRSKYLSSPFTKIIQDAKAFDNNKLKNVVNSRKVKKSGNTNELMNNLYKEAKVQGVSKENVQALITAMALNMNESTPEFIQALYNLAEGDLKLVLGEILQNKENYSSNSQVIDELINRADAYDYTSDDVIALLEEYTRKSDMPVKDMLNLLNQLTDVNLAEVLKSIEDSENFTSIHELIDYLEKQGNYSKQELEQIQKLLQAYKLINSNDKQVERFERIMSDAKAFDNNKLKNVVNSDRVSKSGNANDLINNLNKEAKAQGVSKENVQALITALALNLNESTPEFIQALHNLAEGDLKVVLGEMLKNKENYSSNSQVIDELMNRADAYDYTSYDVIALLEEYTRKSDMPVEDMIKLLNQILDKDILTILNDIPAGITSIEELIEYLENQNLYTQEEISQLYQLLKAISYVDLIKEKDFRLNNKKQNAFILTGIACLIIFILLFIFKNNKKKKTGKKDTNN